MILDGNRSAFHLYVVRLADLRRRRAPAGLRRAARGGASASTCTTIPCTCSLTTGRSDFREGHCPEAEAHGESAITLPLFPGLTLDAAGSRRESPCMNPCPLRPDCGPRRRDHRPGADGLVAPAWKGAEADCRQADAFLPGRAHAARRRGQRARDRDQHQFARRRDRCRSAPRTPSTARAARSKTCFADMPMQRGLRGAHDRPHYGRLPADRSRTDRRRDRKFQCARASFMTSCPTCSNRPGPMAWLLKLLTSEALYEADREATDRGRARTRDAVYLPQARAISDPIADAEARSQPPSLDRGYHRGL